MEVGEAYYASLLSIDVEEFNSQLDFPDTEGKQLPPDDSILAYLGMSR
jgi:hypothetical protein